MHAVRQLLRDQYITAIVSFGARHVQQLNDETLQSCYECHEDIRRRAYFLVLPLLVTSTQHEDRPRTVMQGGPHAELVHHLKRE